MSQHPKTRREAEVWKACDALWDELQVDNLGVDKLTGDRLKDQLLDMGYKKGDQRQLYQYRASWKQARGLFSMDSSADASNIPPMNDALDRAIIQLREMLQQEADDKFSQAEGQIRADMVVLQQSFDQVQHALTQKTADYDALQEAYTVLKQKHEESQALQQETAQTLGCCQEREQALQASHEAMHQQHQQQLNTLTQAYTENKAQLESQLQQQQARETVMMDSLKQEHEDYRQQMMVKLDALQTDYAKVNKALTQSQQAHTQTQVQLQTESKQHQALQCAFEEIKRTQLKLEQQWHQEHDTLTERLHASQQQLSTLQGELKQAQLQQIESTRFHQQLEETLARYQRQHVHLETLLQQTQTNQSSQ